VEGLKTVSSELKDKLNLYFKLFIILYADDTVIMAESAANLQNQLDSFSDYCDISRLKLNVEKSKIVGFFRKEELLIILNLTLTENNQKLLMNLIIWVCY
jgi:hypothetical protein